ncbi:MAG: hypothetical protein GY780_13410 [bacterium]|nr:hypothetical protein [bacterium]
MKNQLLISIVITCIISSSVCAIAEDFTLAAESPSKRSVKLEEVWRLGGDDEEGTLIGVVSQGVMDKKGNMYLLDNQLSQVLIIDPAGQELGIIGGPGEGPGELNRPTSLFVNNENQIGVAQGFPGKIVLLQTNGDPGGTISLGSDPQTGGFAFVGETFKKNGTLVVNHGSGAFDMESGKMSSTNKLSLINADGQEVARFAEHTQLRELQRQVFNEAENFKEFDTWALGNDFVYTTPRRDEYFITAKNMKGEIVHTLSRPFTPRKRNDEDKEDLTSGFRMVVNGNELEIEKNILDTDPAINQIDVSLDGRLYVVSCFQKKKLLSGPAAKVYDIISPKGKLIEELTLEVPGFNHEQDRLAFVDGIFYLWLRNFESATEAMNSGFQENSQSDDDLGDVEPLEIILCKIPQ